MNQQKFLNLTSTTIVVTLKEECDVKEMFETLSVNDKILSLKFNKKNPVDVHEGSNEIEKTFLATMDGIQRSIDNSYLEITIRVQSKIKLVRLYKKKIIIPGCKSLTEGLKIIDEINDTSQKIKLVIEK